MGKGRDNPGVEGRLDEGRWKDRELLLITFPGRLGGWGFPKRYLMRALFK